MMKKAHVLAWLLAAVSGIGPVHAASEGRAGVSVAPDSRVTAPGYAYKPNISDYYPRQSVQVGEEGSAKVRACYDTKGKVQSADISESSGFARLDEAALRASHDFVFKPGTVDGVPQANCVVLPMRFSLKGPEALAGSSAPGQKRAEGTSQQDELTSTELTYMPDIRGYYPSESRKAGEEGVVVVVVCYNAKGKIVSSKVHSSSGFERLDEAAVRAGSKFRLKPATLNGVPQEGCGVVPVKFSLNR